MKLLFASDSFKGTLTSRQTAELLEKAAREVWEDVLCDHVAVADGGEGTVDAVVDAEQGTTRIVSARDPLMRLVDARYGLLSGNRAVLEMAAASGLPLLSEEERNPLHTTSYGTGELLRDALDQGCTDLSVAIGGSATNDGGMGCARALGVRFLDENGRELSGCGEDLERVAAIDTSDLDPRIRKTKITVMCDVTNPLCGPDGATMTFGAQKGATPEMQARLEAGMQNYRDVLKRTFGVDPDTLPGSGAAGGLGAALCILLGGTLRPGIETVLNLIGFDRRLAGTDLVITGEGRTDWQSCFGKVMQGVGEHCRLAGVPAVGLSGSLGKDADRIFNCGIESLMTTVDAPMPLAEALERAEELYYKGAVRLFRLIRVGMRLR